MFLQQNQAEPTPLPAKTVSQPRVPTTEGAHAKPNTGNPGTTGTAKNIASASIRQQAAVKQRNGTRSAPHKSQEGGSSIEGDSNSRECGGPSIQHTVTRSPTEHNGYGFIGNCPSFFSADATTITRKPKIPIGDLVQHVKCSHG